MVSWLRWSRNQRAASTPMSSSRSSSSTSVPARFDICTRSPPSVRLTSCMITISKWSGSPPSSSQAIFIRLMWPWWSAPQTAIIRSYAARELVGVVGDVHREVGELAGRALEHAVLVVAVRGGAQPGGALGLVHAVEPLDHARHAGRAARARASSGPSAPAGARAMPCTPSRISSIPRCRQLLDVHVGGAVDRGGQLGHVVAVIAVLGRLLAARPGADRLAEAAHLSAGVVHVVLALHAVPGVLEDAAERVAVRAVARRTRR